MLEYTEVEEWNCFQFKAFPPHRTLMNDFVALNADVYAWLNENARNAHDMPMCATFSDNENKYILIKFYNKELALRFKLTWG